MGLFKRGATWWMRFSYRGEQVRRSTETGDRELAKRIYHKVLGEVAEGKWFERLPGEDKGFKEMIEEFIKEIPERSKSSYLSYLKTLLRFFGDCPLTNITPASVNRLKQEMKKKGEAVATINMKIKILKRMFNLSWKEWEWFDRNPITQVSLERGANKRDRWLTREEEDSILSHSEAWMKEIITFALNTGMRLGEIVSLAWSNVDLFRRTVTVTQSKNDEPRTIPMNATVFEMLKEKSRVRSISCDKVFQIDNKPLKNHQIQYPFNKACEKARLSDIHFHDFRHSFATRLVQAGEDLYKVQRLLGHKSPSMTQRYAHHSPESLRSSVEVLDGISTKLAQLTESVL
jgi:integrase